MASTTGMAASELKTMAKRWGQGSNSTNRIARLYIAWADSALGFVASMVNSPPGVAATESAEVASLEKH
jgi:hypothetical protein